MPRRIPTAILKWPKLYYDLRMVSLQDFLDNRTHLYPTPGVHGVRNRECERGRDYLIREEEAESQ